MTKISDFPNLQRKQILPGTFSLEGVSCTLCKVGSYSITKLWQLYLRHREHSSCPHLCCLCSWQQKEPFQPLAPSRPWQQAGAGQRAQRWQPQRSSPPRQQKEVHHLGEKNRENPCYTNWKCPATLYCHQLLICIGSHGANQLGSAIAAVHTLLFKSFGGLGGYLQALLLQHLFPSQSWRQTSLFPTLKHQSKILFFPAQPLQLHLQDSTPKRVLQETHG